MAEPQLLQNMRVSFEANGPLARSRAKARHPHSAAL
jgi:hypothetical protein